jgi:hypothetical protein
MGMKAMGWAREGAPVDPQTAGWGCAASFALVGALLSACSTPHIRIESHLVDLGRDVPRDVTCTPQYLTALSRVTTVAVRAPDSCVAKAASERTGQAQKTEEILRTTCGVEMAEIERALTRQGYVVTSWRDLASMVATDKLAAKDAALKLNAEVLFQVNSLEKVILRPEQARWERTYLASDSRGEPGAKAELSEAEEEALRAASSQAEKTVLERAPAGAMLDINAILVQSGQTIWFYRWARAQRPERTDSVAKILVVKHGANWTQVVPEGGGHADWSADPPKEGRADDARYFGLLREVVSDFANEFRTAEACASRASKANETPLPLATTDESPESLLARALDLRVKGLRSEEEQSYRRCVKLSGKFAPCHFGLFEVFREARREKDAKTACQNFIKFADPVALKGQVEVCATFLKSAR